MVFKPPSREAFDNDKPVSEDIVQSALGSVAKGGALILVGILCFKLFNFIRQFAIIRILSPAEYGLFSLGMTVITIYMIFGNLGLHSGSQRYIAFFQARDEEPRTRGIILSALRIVFFTATAITVVSLFLASPLADLFNKPGEEQVLLWFTALIPLSVGIQLMSSFFLGFKKPSFTVFVENIGLSLVSLIAVVLFLLVRESLTSVLVAQVIAHTIVFLAGLLYAVRHFPIPMRGRERVMMGKELLLFSIPLFASTALSYLMVQTDTLMLGYYTASDQLGFYNAAYLLASVLPVFLMAASNMFLPVASGLVAREHHRELRNIYRSTTKWLFIFTLPLFLTFFLFPSQTMSIAFGGGYPTAAQALQLLCLGDFVHTLLGPNGMTLVAYGHSRILLLSTAVATVTNVILNAILIPRHGITGAATASFIALILVNVLISGYLLLRYRIHPFGASYAKPVVILIVVAGVLYYPLLALLDVSRWFLLAYYPLFLFIALGITYASRSLETTDRLLISAARRRFFARKGS